MTEATYYLVSFSSIITSRLALVGPTLLRWPGLRLLPTSGIIRFMSSLS